MLKSLYYKALNNRRYIELEQEKDDNSFLKGKWFDKSFSYCENDFSIAAGDGSFNKKKFLMFNYCPIGAEALIFDGELKHIEQSEIFEKDHLPYLDELLSTYMSIFEFKCCLKAINEYDVDYYLFDGSILGDLQNPYPMGSKFPEDIKKNLDGGVLSLFLEKINDLSDLGLSFPFLLDKVFKHASKDNIDDYKLHLSSIEKLLLLREILMKNKKIISISKTSSANDLFKSKAPDIAIFDQYTQKEGMSLVIKKKVKLKSAFPVFNDFFTKLWFTIFYIRLEDNKNILKIELPYKASNDEIIKVIGIIKRDLSEGYPYLLKKAHNDVIIKNNDVEDLLKIGRVYQTTNREQLKM